MVSNLKLLTNLSFTANITALACSAAFPTIGSKTVLMNAIGIFQALEAPCKPLAVLTHISDLSMIEDKCDCYKF